MINFNLRIIVIIDPKRCLRAIVSPRQRALKTFHLAFTYTREPPHEISEDVREWDYGKFNLCLRDEMNLFFPGNYDGLTLAEILKTNPTWNVWTDG